MIKFKMPVEVQAFFKAYDCLEPVDIKYLGHDEGEVVQSVKDGVDAQHLNLGVIKNVRKLYALCSSPGAAGSSAGVGPASFDDEAPIPDGVPEAIESAWIKRHGFHLAGARLLAGGDYNRIYNCLNKKNPRELPKMDPEKFRIQTEGITGESKGMFISEDGKVAAKKEYWSEIVSADQFWWKIRAYLCTVAYLTILNPDFFPYQAAEGLIDTIHDIILAPTLAVARLPITQCKIAWKL